MILDKSSLTEEAHIAEDLLQGKVNDLSRKCIVVKQTVRDGDFTLNEALNLYQVSEKDYTDFLVNNFIAELQASFDSDSKKVYMLHSIAVFAGVYDSMFGALDKESDVVIKHFKTLSKAIKNNKVKI